MRASLFYLPSVGSRAEIERGMAGLRRELYQRMLGRGLPAPQTGELPDLPGEGPAPVGSPDTVARQFERLLERLPCRWLFCWEWNSPVPDDALRRSIELFATDVLPRVGESPEPPVSIDHAVLAR
ncbi:MAG: hypothetical protein ACOYXM_04490 [Actinomycetota bacterium]